MRLYLYGALALLGAAYLAWSIWGPRPLVPGQAVTAQPAKAVEDLPQRVITPRRVVVIADGPRAAEKLKIGPPVAHEEVQTSVTVPETKYGGTASVFLNTSSGQSRTIIKANEAPWFRFERGNTLGVGVGIGRDGRYFTADYQRDLLSIKGAVVTVRAGVTSWQDRTDAKGEARIEYRW
jgi:hypothetical protein